MNKFEVYLIFFKKIPHVPEICFDTEFKYAVIGKFMSYVIYLV